MIKRLLLVVAMLSGVSFGQEYLSFAASSCIRDAAGNALGSGTITIQATDDSNRPVAYRTSGSSQIITSPVVWAILTGSVNATLPKLGNPATTVPQNIKYHFSIKNGLTGQLTNYSLVSIFDNVGNGTFNWCAFNPGLTIGALTVPIVGPTGPQGAQGIAGPQGTPGVAGPSGPQLNYRGTWSSLTAYVINDEVVLSGVLYQAVASSTNITPGTDTSKWQVLSGLTGPTGPAGSPGTVPVYTALPAPGNPGALAWFTGTSVTADKGFYYDFGAMWGKTTGGEVDPRFWGAKCDAATDDGVALSNAFAVAITSGQGGFFVPGTCLTSTIFPSGGSVAAAVKFRGVSGNVVGQGFTNKSRIVYTGAGSTRAFDFRSNYGINSDGVGWQYNNCSFTGRIIDMSHNGGIDSTNFHIHDSDIGGTGAAVSCGGGPSATIAVSLDCAISGAIDHNRFDFVQVGIEGKNSDSCYSNAINVEDNVFYTVTSADVRNAGQGWKVHGNTAEGTNGGGPAYMDTLTYGSAGMDMAGWWVGDGTTINTPWFQFKAPAGISFHGNVVFANPNNIITNYAGTASGTNWTTATNATGAPNGTVAAYNNTLQNPLILTNFGFASQGQWLHAKWIKILVHGYAADGTGNNAKIAVALTKNGTTPATVSQVTAPALGLNTATLTFRGNWSSVTAYVISDEVFQVSDGNTYIALSNNTNQLPSSFPAVWKKVTTSYFGFKTLMMVPWNISDADIIASTFGVMIYDYDGTASGLSIDSVSISVTYDLTCVAITANNTPGLQNWGGMDFSGNSNCSIDLGDWSASTYGPFDQGTHIGSGNGLIYNSTKKHPGLQMDDGIALDVAYAFPADPTVLSRRSVLGGLTMGSPVADMTTRLAIVGGGISASKMPDISTFYAGSSVQNPGAAACTYDVYGKDQYGKRNLTAQHIVISNCPNTLSAANYVALSYNCYGANTPMAGLVGADVTKGGTTNFLTSLVPSPDSSNCLQAYDIGQSTSAYVPPLFDEGGSVNGTSVAGVYKDGVLQSNERLNWTTKVLAAGVATWTFANGFSFTSTSTYGCTCTDQTSAASCKAVPATAASVTLAGTGTDTVYVKCTGN